MTRRVFIKTWGCQMNVYDSARMADLLAPVGYGPADRPEAADLIILNTCHIREKATEKLFSELGRLRRIQEDRRKLGADQVIAVAGCVAQAEGEAIIDRAPYVDLVVGPQSFQDLPDLLARLGRESGLVATDFPEDPKFDGLPEETTGQGVSAHLAIQEGCDKFCSFCVVPYTRGAEYSRPAADVIAEARRLIATGAREITLLGQNVNAWHGLGTDGRSWGLGRLIRALAELDGLARIRFTTSHPSDMDDDLIAAHAEVPQLMPYVHLPVQAGSDRILKAMNRRHSADDYRRIIDKLRAARADIALSSDFIVGFPGETDADFAATLRLVAEIGFASAYSFKYSPRPGTPATDRAEQVPEAIKDDRLQSLQQLLSEQQRAFNAGSIGTTVPVLFDRKGSRAGQLHGRTPHNQALHATAPERLIGSIVDVTITQAHANSVGGRIVTQTPEMEDAA